MKTAKSKRNSAPRQTANGSNGDPTAEQIALRAYSIWEEQGQPKGRDLENWLQAESQLREAHHQQTICS